MQGRMLSNTFVKENLPGKEGKKKILKETVSRELSWVLLYINRKLFPRADVANCKILILLKGHFAIYKRRSCSVKRAQQFEIVQTILESRCSKNGWLSVFSQNFEDSTVFKNYAVGAAQ